ncbi:hypothetical protein O7606_03845 [Micromonospora sp. WMMD882]|uniref:hypothetical protein n=1 Tax=Micromonospora sp. WMMD882 TaxID=3015151 RepID=UPI00248B1B2F|nr:hypothetical protein [Micromonospora sp. WMMD882]WBB80530.1 hypothetical protein O7606_03845 [Micromonospora sp. WMMD882]
MRVETDERPGGSTRTLTGVTVDPERGRAGRWRAALRTTPARIVLYGAVLLLLLVTTAVVALRSAAPAGALGERSASTAARTSTNARQIYVLLADTDVAASAVFLLSPGDRERAGLEAAYQDKVRAVERALNRSMGAAADDRDRLTRLAGITARFQRYQRVVDDGLAVVSDGSDIRRGVLASAYAAQASHYMTDQVLDAAQSLWNYDTRLLREARGDAGWWASAALGTPLVTLAALGGVQWWLWRRTRRRLNAGLLVATVSVLAVLGLAVASWSHWPAATHGFPALAETVETQSATQERLGDVLAGRAAVYLALGASVDPAVHRAAFDGRRLCDSGPGSVGFDCRALDKVWGARQSQEPDAFRDAVRTVLDQGRAGESFEAASTVLTRRLDEGDTTVTTAVTALPTAPRHLGGPAAWLTLLAGVGVLAGLRRRLVEYR